MTVLTKTTVIAAMLAMASAASAQQQVQGDYGDGVFPSTVEFVPYDPVAGNPNSLMTRMVAADFALGTTIGSGSGVFSEGAGGGAAPALIGVGFGRGRTSTPFTDVDYTEFQLTYAKPLADPRYAIVLSLPVSVMEFDTFEAYSVSAGVGLRLAVLDNWQVTPSVRIGHARWESPVDVEGALVGASIVSNYQFSFGGMDGVIANMVTHTRTTGALDNDYEIDSKVYRNGLGLSGPLPFELFGQRTTWEFTAVNTRFHGSEVFVKNQNDYALSFGTVNSRNGVTWDSVRIGITYTNADRGADGLAVNFGYQF